MGYACPVCGEPQADGEHLANHLAFTAVLHGEEHEAWLDERVPGWADGDAEGLAGEVVEHAEEIDHETVFEDTTGGRPDVELGPTHHRDEAGHRHHHGSREELDPEALRIVEEAIEMTRRRSGDERERRDGDAEE